MRSEAKRPFYARIEYRSVQAQVETKLNEGHSVKAIYDQLLIDGRLTMAYATFCDYVRGGGTRLHGSGKKGKKKTCSDLLSEILDSIETRTETSCNLKLVYQRLVECGLIGIGYSDFCDYFRRAGGYIGRDIPDDFIFFDDDGLITFYYQLESFLKAETELGQTASQNLQ